MRVPAAGDGGQEVRQQRRKNRRPTVREAQGNTIFRIEHGEPHDPCPVPGCRGTLLFLHR